MAFKVQLSAALPDFKLPVKFNTPSGEEAEITFNAKHKPTSEITEMLKTPGITNQEVVSGFTNGWDLEDEFNVENVKRLVDIYPAVVVALTHEYMLAMAGNRTKN